MDRIHTEAGDVIFFWCWSFITNVGDPPPPPPTLIKTVKTFESDPNICSMYPKFFIVCHKAWNQGQFAPAVMVITWVMSIYSQPLLHSMKCWHVVLCCRCHYLVCKWWYTLCDISDKYIQYKDLTLEIYIQHKGVQQLCLCGFITSYGIPSSYSC